MDTKIALITTDGADNPPDLKICLITKQVCSMEACLLWLKLDDWEGCPFDLASGGLKQAARIGAGKLAEFEQSSEAGAKVADSIISLIKKKLGKKED